MEEAEAQLKNRQRLKAVERHHGGGAMQEAQTRDGTHG